MKTLTLISALFISFVTSSIAKAPRGYEPTTKFEEVQETAISKKKLITILFQGNNHSCPNCVTTIENGERATKTSSVMMYSSVESYWEKSTQLPEKILDQVGTLSGGASVYFYVFDPNSLELIAKGDRSVLQSDKQAIRDFKKKVKEAKKKI